MTSYLDHLKAWGRLWSLALFLLFWQIAAWALQTKLLPTPVSVLSRLWEQLTQGELLYHLGMTLMRVGLSFTIAMFIGVALGMLMGSRDIWNRWLDSLLILALNIPALVTIILCYIWFGLTEIAAVLAVSLNKIPTVLVTVREGAKAIDHKLMAVAKVYQLSRRDTFFKVYLPQLYPYLFGAGRNGLALIWKIVLVVELLGRSDGVGFQLGTFFQFFDITSILAYTVAFAAVIFVLETTLVRPLERYVNRWRVA